MTVQHQRCGSRGMTSIDKFMVTNNQRYGMSLSDIVLPKHFETESSETKDENSSEKLDLSFLYSRESDRIGIGISNSDSVLASVLLQQDSRSSDVRRRRHSIVMKDKDSRAENLNFFSNKSSESSRALDLRETLEAYNHSPKRESPLYGTSSNQYGLRKPSVATYTATRIPRSQKFSNSFNKMMPRDQGLNTSLTHNNVHHLLDPQFTS
mmetsp:Transcript_18551/g.21349  ORF Transcript_18551/g.21349 Transcript_18551/m.21349 type:complete len:209 (-) Transcript_18551:72-698(-)